MPHRPLANEAGVMFVELALVLIVMLTMVFAIIDVGRAIHTKQIMTNLSREAANLAARGTPLAEAAAAEVTAAAPTLDIATDGRIVMTVVRRDLMGVPKISSQFVIGGTAGTSAVGQLGANLPMTVDAIGPAIAEGLPAGGGNLYVAEVFYDFQPATPVGALINSVLAGKFYDAAYF